MASPYLLWGIAAVVVGLLVVVLMRRERKGFGELDALQSLSIPLVVLGILFGDDRLVGYSFIGAGVLLAVLSAVLKRRGGEASRAKS